MNVGPLFVKLREAEEKHLVLQGGGDAGKTVTALQHLGVCAVEFPEVITVTAQDTPNLRVGALRAFETYVASDPEIYPYIQSYHKTDRIYTFRNKSIIEFKGFEDEQTARGSTRDRLFMNEANSRSYMLAWQLQRKTRKQCIYDYNPSAKFWIHNKVLPGPDQDKQFAGRTRLFIVDHRHNPFLTAEDHEAYESISDPELFRVYARGLTGKVTGLIFGHFKKIPDWPDESLFERVFWGIDYGYTSDPTAIVKIGAIGRRRWMRECSYAPGIGPEGIRAIFDANGYRDNQPIFSETDPNMIHQLRTQRLSVYPAIKGPGSKSAGISKVREMECFYQGENFEKEVNTYKFVTAQDLVTGKEILTNTPVDGWDHLCDAAMYGIYTDAIRGRQG